MAVWDQLRNEGALTASEHAVARYVLAHGDAVPSLSLSELAQRTHVSGSTIIRLSQKLGFTGFPAFKVAVAREHEALDGTEAPVDVDVPFAQGATTRAIGDAFFRLTLQALRDVKDEVPERLLVQAAAAIHRAESVCFYGRGESLLIMEDFRQKLSRIGVHCDAEPLNGFDGALAQRGGRRNLAFIVSHYADTNWLYNIFDEISYQHTPIILLCSTSAGPLARRATVAITVRSAETRAKFGSFAARTAMTYVLDCIFGIVFNMDYEANVEKLRALTRRNEQRNLYLK